MWAESVHYLGDDMTETGYQRAAAPQDGASGAQAYEPPQLWQYGSLRVETAHGFTGSILDNSLNIS
ncbi:MAG TPA: hypothetical protein VNV66_20115 [Pilimelia sp.]|nr:hypothetical protein [Pilimelia sp.]